MALVFGLWMAGVLGYKVRYVKPHPYSVPVAELRAIEAATQPVVIFDGIGIHERFSSICRRIFAIRFIS